MIRGELFTRYFLDDGIREMDQYRHLAAAEVAAFAEAIREHWAHLEQMPHPSEPETENEFIFPILGLLGWEHLPQQEPGRGRRDIADALLFVDAGTKARARPRAAVDRFRLGAVVVENEARDTRLDRGGGSHEAPSSQILRYLGRAEAQTGGALRWGLLTNGRLWRIYWAQARARAEGFVEIDLPAIVGDLPPPAPPGADPQHWLRVFMLLFGRNALVEEGARGAISRSLKAGATSSKSPRHCRGSSSAASIPSSCQRLAMPPLTRNRTTRLGGRKCETPACACSSDFFSYFTPKIATFSRSATTAIDNMGCNQCVTRRQR
jgi:hypothetical protein